nr:hypothetical protein [Tanacetum cinerariifolium]
RKQDLTRSLQNASNVRKQVTLLGSADLSAFISAKPTIPADRVITAKASVLAVDGIPADSEFAMMSLPSK